MKAIKKQTFYQLDPRFFKDYSGNGTGDLKGLAAKVDYFDFIGVKNLILNNLLALDKDQKIQEYTRISQELGTVNELKTIISLLDSKGINLFIEIPIGSIKESHRWFQKAIDKNTKGFNKLIEFKPNVDDTLKSQQFKYSQEQKGYYEYDETTQEIPLNWSDNSVIENFAEVVRYWNSIGIQGFVFTDFEYIADSAKKEIMNDATLRELRKFYNTIKAVNDNITVVGKSKIIFEDSYTTGPSKVFDYFMTEQFSMLGLHKQFKTDIIGKFKPYKLVKMLSSFATNPNHIVSFGSSIAGRINSRWGNSGQWSHESAKIFSMLLLLNPASSAIYYGDEIGALNIGLTRLDDFQDNDLFLRKESLLKDGVKDAEIMNAQILQAPINSRSLMAWDDTKNGGFSNNEKTITPVSTTYREINVKNQFADESSPLLFTKELLRIVTTSSYKDLISKGKFSISSLIPGVIKLVFKLNKRELKVYMNLTDKVRPIKKAKVGQVILSNKYHKIYNQLPKSLDAFEGIIISKQTDEAYKETVQLKLHKQKERIKSEKEAEKTKILEIKNKEKEAKRLELEKEKKSSSSQKCSWKSQKRKTKRNCKIRKRRAKSRNCKSKTSC